MKMRFGTGFLTGRSAAFIALVAYLAIVFITGGGSRSDIQSLIILRPIAAIACVFALWRVQRSHLWDSRGILAIAAAVVLVVLLHLVPLPPSIWGHLPGRDLVTEIDQSVGLGDVWRPISLIPSATWNALYSLLVPLAVLLLGIQISREERFLLLPVLLVLGLFSGLLGMLQAVGNPNGPLYFYEITNNGAAVGLFANRNHQAVLLAIMFPALAVYASAEARSEKELNLRSWMAFVAGISLIPLVLVTGSRTGLALSLLGLVVSAVLYRRPRSVFAKKRKVVKFNWRIPIAGFTALCLGAITVMVSRAEAINRLTAPDQVEELRFLVWGPILKAAIDYFPMGSGIGSFVEVYRVHEPDALLSPDYLNHAHNDFLELFLTGGLPAIAILAVVLACYLLATWNLWRTRKDRGREVQFGRLGWAVLLILGLASGVDYPLRTPIMAALFVVAVVWLWSTRSGWAKTSGDSSAA